MHKLSLAVKEALKHTHGWYFTDAVYICNANKSFQMHDTFSVSANFTSCMHKITLAANDVLHIVKHEA